MLPNETPIVIAIAGPSGSGKTTLVQTVAAQLAPATQVYFDDYAASSAYPADLTSWLEGGADPNAWQTPQLAADLRTLRAGAAIVPPGTATPLAPAPYIVLEEPFGRERQEMAASIDYVVVIDIPLDLALARRLRRDLHWVRAQGRSESQWLEPVLEAYLAYGSTLYATVNRRAMASSDLVVDGQQPSVVQAQRVVEGVRTRFTGPGRHRSLAQTDRPRAREQRRRRASGRGRLNVPRCAGHLISLTPVSPRFGRAERQRRVP